MSLSCTISEILSLISENFETYKHPPTHESSIYCAGIVLHSKIRGVATGGISVYIPPKSVILTNFYVVTGCFNMF